MIFHVLLIVLLCVFGTRGKVSEHSVCHPKRFATGLGLPNHVWCLPEDYDKDVEPFINEIELNYTLPWNYDFLFDIREIVEVNSQERTVTLSMYFDTSWQDPRLVLNENSTAWDDSRLGPKGQVTISSKHLVEFWNPQLEIYGLEKLQRFNLMGEMSGLSIGINKTIHYSVLTSITVSCKMYFVSYPFDTNVCLFQVGSYYGTNETIKCRSTYEYDKDRQRVLPYLIELRELDSDSRTVLLYSGLYNVCGFEMVFKRQYIQLLCRTTFQHAWLSFSPGLLFS